ncbi:MAG: TlpA disulfide reductase family protein [Bacteroidales bacterium]|nr:AhpC/TSA family protein [Bacteroidales bacterium]
MKNFLPIVLVLFIIQACGSGSNQFSIEGNLDNANNERLYLLELKTDGVNKVDSVQLDQDGEFEFEGYTEVAKFFLVRTSPQNSVTLVVEPDNHITLKGDAQNMGNDYKVSGSEGSREIMKLRKRLESTIASLDSLGQIYQNNPDQETQDDLKNRLNKESRKIVQDQKEYTKDFIDRNINSLASLMALYQQIGPRSYVLNPQQDFAYFEKVDSALMANYPNSEPVKSLHSQVEEMKKKMEADNAASERLGVGKEAPEIALPNPEGDTVRLSSLRGDYVLLDFWAAWCKPCRVENPNLVETYKKFKDEDFEIYQVSLDKSRSDWLNAIEKDELGDWYHVSDLEFWNSRAAQKYNIRSIPASFLLNKQGEIIAKNLRGDDLPAKLNEIFSDQ